MQKIKYIVTSECFILPTNDFSGLNQKYLFIILLKQLIYYYLCIKSIYIHINNKMYKLNNTPQTTI